MNKKDRVLLYSITAKDCDWDYFTGSGAGGQKRNKTAMCVRCTHRASGAVGVCKQHRQQSKNKAAAFRAMATSKTFQAWHRIESAKQCGDTSLLMAEAQKEFKSTDLVVEKRVNGIWVKMES